MNERSTPDVPVIRLDAESRIEAFGPEAEALFGCPAAQALGRPLAEVAAEAVRRARDRADETFKELDRLAYGISHDLRAPLRHLQGFARLLKDELGPDISEDARHFLQIISESAQRMNQLLEAMLEVSRIGSAPLHRAPVDMNALVKEAQRQFRDELKGREVAWQIGPLPEVQGDPVMLRQALINLLSNAIKYTRNQPRPKIEITAEERSDEFVFHVQDNGVGFDSAYADKLFGVFQRLHPTGEFEGIGIGLANVRRVIQRHGGRVWAQGAPGKGATFHFALPKSAE